MKYVKNDELFEIVFGIVKYGVKNKNIGGIVNDRVRELIKKEKQNDCNDIGKIMIRVASDFYATIVMKDVFDISGIENKRGYVYRVLKNTLLDEAKMEKKRLDIQNGIFDKDMKSLRYDVNPLYYNLYELVPKTADTHKDIQAKLVVDLFREVLGDKLILELLLDKRLNTAIKDVYDVDDNKAHNILIKTKAAVSDLYNMINDGI